MPKRSDIEKLRTRAADLRKIAKKSATKVGRHIAEQMASEAERAATNAEADKSTKH
jgi:F0F1-type ATP synthase membrane subunit b/b'